MKVVFDLDSNVPFYKMPSNIFGALVETLPEHKLFKIKHRDLKNEIVDADVVVSFWVPPKTFSLANNLKAIFYAIDGVSKEHLYPEVLESKVVVTNSGGCRTEAIAEHTFSMILACSRKLIEASQRMSPKDWWGNSLNLSNLTPYEIMGKTICIFGLGKIGMRVAEIAKCGFQMKTIGIKQTDKPVDNVDKVYTTEDIALALENSDIVVCALPRTKKTEKFFNNQVFSMMKNSCTFINISNGNLVDESALISSIKSGIISSAGLDVFSTEPIDPSSQLLSMPQVITSPHSAGMTPEFWPRFARLVRDNIMLLVDGKIPKNIIKKELGY